MSRLCSCAYPNATFGLVWWVRKDVEGKRKRRIVPERER